MKNVIFGIVGTAILLYTMAISLGIYQAGIRKNELEQVVSMEIKNALTGYYGKDVSDEFVSEEVKRNIEEAVFDDSIADINVKVCDMKKGIISLIATEKLKLPGGREKEIRCHRTVIADREI